MSNVIVFGATGAVGSAAAVEASERGATVWLAMRDTSKKIKTISEEQEKKGDFKRIEADLTDPASITKAINESGAKSAFIYGIWQSKDFMKSAVQALKDAGVTWIVFLSSYTIPYRSDKRQITPDEVIPYMHAQVEIAIEEAGVSFAAIRPGFFASNEFVAAGMLSKGFYQYPYPEIKFDHIDPMNIGQVAGAVLVEPKDLKPSEPLVVYVMGPQFTTVRDAMSRIGKSMGQDHIEMKVISPEEWLKFNMQFMPEITAKYILKNAKALHDNPDLHAEEFKDGSKNIYKYTGKQPTKFEDWVEANKAGFQAKA